MKFADGDTLLFTGDSITDCGRAWPVGERAGLGDGYVAFVDSLLSVYRPDIRIRVLNTGISGNRVIDLAARWQRDVLALEPDWLSVLIGINDVWWQFDPVPDPNQVTIERYENVYRRLLERTRPDLKGLILMAPYVIEPSPNDPMRTRMDAYGQVVQRLAADFDAVFVDLQAAFNRYLAHRPSQTLCDDRVHPNMTGHMIIASAFLTAVGADWNPAAKP